MAIRESEKKRYDKPRFPEASKVRSVLGPLSTDPYGPPFAPITREDITGPLCEEQANAQEALRNSSQRLGPKPPTEEDFNIKVEDARKIIAARAATMVDPTMKDINPKDAIAADKMPLHLWPESATILGCLALLDGASKYGRANWRGTEVLWSVYFSAARRHMLKMICGEDADEDSGLPHEAHILACWAIILDARVAGTLVDDRDYKGAGVLKLLKDMTPMVKKIKATHADKKPKHWTIKDNKAE